MTKREKIRAKKADHLIEMWKAGKGLTNEEICWLLKELIIQRDRQPDHKYVPSRGYQPASQPVNPKPPAGDTKLQPLPVDPALAAELEEDDGF